MDSVFGYRKPSPQAAWRCVRRNWRPRHGDIKFTEFSMKTTGSAEKPQVRFGDRLEPFVRDIRLRLRPSDAAAKSGPSVLLSCNRHG